MGSEYGKDDERQVGIPYDPVGPERVRLANEVRRELVRYLGTDTIVRFKHRERYKVKLPTGEELLRHVRFEHCGVYKGHEQITADVHLPCALPGGDIFDLDPYEQLLELRIPKRHMPDFQDDAEVPPRELEQTAETSDAIGETQYRSRQLLAIVLVGGAILVCGAVMHHGARVREWWKDATKQSETEPQPVPIQLPEPWIRY